jgi:hypothetical protein
MSRHKTLAAAVTAMTVALLFGLNAGVASAASTPTSQRTNTSVNSAHNSVATAKPHFFIGFCITVWSGTVAVSNCQNGIGFYNQYIHCAGIARPVLGLVTTAPSIYIGSCPAGHNVVDAGVDFL